MDAVFKRLNQELKKSKESEINKGNFKRRFLKERLCSIDMGHYFRIAPDARGLNYDKFYVEGKVATEGKEAYTSHNTNRLDVDDVVKKIMGKDYVKEELEGRPYTVEA